MGNVLLSDLFHVKGRFQRSVHLERDFYSENSLNEYLFTVTAREMLERIVATLEKDATSQAWSITGPYGSGKSAFALFAAKLLGNSDDPTTQHAIDLLRSGDPSLYERFISTNGNGKNATSGFCPVLISGERAPLSLSLLRGLERGLTAANGGLQSISLIQQLEHLLEKAENNNLPSTSEITNLYELVTRQICNDGGDGLLLIVDELGKFLEYATQHPEQGDMLLLQNLAEFADRSKDTPFFLMTILHQAFESYAQRTAKSQREEWAKVQGRFEDVAFVEPTEQVLRLIGQALENSSETDYRHNHETTIELELKPQQLENKEFSQLLHNCLPLHPTVALVIGPVFKRFAQNERSLFAFLSSNEPHGLQDFLLNHHYDGSILPTYTLANLYDYLNSAHGNRIYTGDNGKKWIEIESAINQLENPSEMMVKMIKTIGILNIVSEPIPNLKASEQLLRYALDDNTKDYDTVFKDILSTLKDRSIAIYRRYNKAYALWEGSDIDIEEQLREAERHIGTNVPLANELTRYIPTRSLVAQRHSYQTGTLRYFSVRYTDYENLDNELSSTCIGEEGILLYVIPGNEKEAHELIRKVRDEDTTKREDVLIAIPLSIGFLYESVTALACLKWVKENTPELESDAVARDELSTQLKQIESDVSDQLTMIFDGDNGYDCTWYHKGKPVDSIVSQRTRNAYLSLICDDIYHNTPIIKNELINRRKISGASTTARRKLIQHMLENGDQEDLGITGYPPEMSIYRSLLWKTGIHRCETGRWGFHSPKEDDESNIGETWGEIEEFFSNCETTRQPVEKLYERLMAPPYGVRSGPLPILLCAAILHYKTEIALYEKGSFIPALTVPIFERLLKAPGQFELKRFRKVGIRADLFTRYIEILNQSQEIEKPDLLTVVTPLMVFFSQLPKYTLYTQELSDAAKGLRTVINNANEPDELLFKQLPDAIGFPNFGTEKVNSEEISTFFNSFQGIMSELGQAYGELLNSVERMIADVFKLKTTAEELQEELITRSQPLLEVAIETQLKGFLINVCNDGFDLNGWLEAIATFLAKKPPTSWLDSDKAQFEMNLSQLARKFHHFETVSYEKLKYPDSSEGEPIRVGITRPNLPEQEWVVTLPVVVEEQVSEFGEAINEAFDKLNVDSNANLRSAILARISQEWMQKCKNQN